MKTLLTLIAVAFSLTVGAQTFNEGDTIVITFTQLSPYQTRLYDVSNTNAPILLRTFATNQIVVVAEPVLAPGIYQLEVKGLPARKYSLALTSVTPPDAIGVTLESDPSTNALVTIKPRAPGLSKVEKK